MCKAQLYITLKRRNQYVKEICDIHGLRREQSVHYGYYYLQHSI